MTENLYTKDCIRTYTGLYMNVFEPTLEMICIEDIAHALSHIPRFGGHTKKFYSVAEHCLLLWQNANSGLKLQALMHDASEAYLLDIPSPIKKQLKGYKEMEDRLMNLIAEKYGFEYPLSEHVKQLDKEALRFEWDNAVLKTHESLSPQEAKQRFINAASGLI